jgi:hypothetical protein
MTTKKVEDKSARVEFRTGAHPCPECAAERSNRWTNIEQWQPTTFVPLWRRNRWISKGRIECSKCGVALGESLTIDVPEGIAPTYLNLVRRNGFQAIYSRGDLSSQHLLYDELNELNTHQWGAIFLQNRQLPQLRCDFDWQVPSKDKELEPIKLDQEKVAKLPQAVQSTLGRLIRDGFVPINARLLVEDVSNLSEIHLRKVVTDADGTTLLARVELFYWERYTEVV